MTTESLAKACYICLKDTDSLLSFITDELVPKDHRFGKIKRDNLNSTHTIENLSPNSLAIKIADAVSLLPFFKYN